MNLSAFYKAYISLIKFQLHNIKKGKHNMTFTIVKKSHSINLSVSQYPFYIQ